VSYNLYISQELINEKTLKEAISRTIMIKISDIKDFLVLLLSPSAFKTRLLPEVQHQSSHLNSLNSDENIEVTYSIKISNSSYNTSYYTSGLKSSLNSGQFSDNVYFYSRQNNISVFKDMVFVSFDFSSELVPTINPSTISSTVNITSRLPTISKTNIPTMINYLTSNNPTTLIPSTVVPSILFATVPTASPSVSPSRNPTVVSSSGPTVVPTIAPSSLPSVVPSVNPTTVPTVSPSVSPSHNSTVAPSSAPSIVPSSLPSVVPSVNPIPTTHLSLTPSIGSTSRSPLDRPTFKPTVTRTVVPSIKPGDPTLTPTCKIYLIDFIKSLILLFIFTL